MKKVLITGVAGFFGHHLLEHILKNTDWEVVGLDGINYAGNLCRINDISVFADNEKRVKLIWHDLCSPINEDVAYHIGDVNYIIHTAAETHVDRSLIDSKPFVLANIIGTCHMLEYAKHQQKNMEKYIQFSTDEVFGAAPIGVDYKEWDRHQPSNPYAATKAGSDDLAYSFAHSFKMPIIITHTMNMFGERQNVEKFIPMTIRKVILGDTVIIHGTENNVSTRKWIHCRNAADACIFLLDKGVPEDKYNIVGVEYDVLSIAKFIAEYLNKPLKYEYLDFHKTRPGHDLRYSLDNSKMMQMGWNPKMSFWDSLIKVINWELDNRKWIRV